MFTNLSKLNLNRLQKINKLQILFKLDLFMSKANLKWACSELNAIQSRVALLVLYVQGQLLDM